MSDPHVEPQHHPRCFGCGPDNPDGLGMPWHAVAGEAYEAELVLPGRFQGAPGLAHGGIVTAVLDEAMGILAQHLAFPSVTARCTSRYRRPVPVGERLQVRASVERRAGRQLHVRSELRRDGVLLAEGEGLFARVPLRHFLQTEAGRELRDRLAAEQAGAG